MHKRAFAFILFLAAAAFIAAFSIAPLKGRAQKLSYPIGSFDSFDTAVVISADAKKQTITFLNIILNKRYTLNYTGTTVFKNKYGSAISAHQITPGIICDVRFIKSQKLLSHLYISKQSWIIETLTGLDFTEKKRNIELYGATYKLDDFLVFFNDSKLIDAIDISPSDTLTLRGIGERVLSADVTRGHGWLRLTGGEALIGGYIEVGTRYVYPITQGMLLTVPEGHYTVNVSHGGLTGQKDALIVKNGELELDVSDIQGDVVKTGNVFFSVTPSGADVYIDGQKTDISSAVPIECGLHQMIVRASGYQTLTKFIRVGADPANLSVDLEPAPTPSVQDPDAISTAAPDNNNNHEANDILDLPSAVEGSYKVTIEAPSGAEVYSNGSYLGIAPVAFTKKSGVYSITLRKSGYQTRSYTIEVDSSQRDESFSFTDLAPIN